jgi:hypothetical protein
MFRELVRNEERAKHRHHRDGLAPGSLNNSYSLTRQMEAPGLGNRSMDVSVVMGRSMAGSNRDPRTWKTREWRTEQEQAAFERTRQLNQSGIYVEPIIQPLHHTGYVDPAQPITDDEYSRINNAETRALNLTGSYSTSRGDRSVSQSRNPYARPPPINRNFASHTSIVQERPGSSFSDSVNRSYRSPPSYTRSPSNQRSPTNQRSPSNRSVSQRKPPPELVFNPRTQQYQKPRQRGQIFNPHTSMYENDPDTRSHADRMWD